MADENVNNVNEGEIIKKVIDDMKKVSDDHNLGDLGETTENAEKFEMGPIENAGEVFTPKYTVLTPEQTGENQEEEPGFWKDMADGWKGLGTGTKILASAVAVTLVAGTTFIALGGPGLFINNAPAPTTYEQATDDQNEYDQEFNRILAGELANEGVDNEDVQVITAGLTNPFLERFGILGQETATTMYGPTIESAATLTTENGRTTREIHNERLGTTGDEGVINGINPLLINPLTRFGLPGREAASTMYGPTIESAAALTVENGRTTREIHNERLGITPTIAGDEVEAEDTTNRINPLFINQFTRFGLPGQEVATTMYGPTIESAAALSAAAEDAAIDAEEAATEYESQGLVLIGSTPLGDGRVTMNVYYEDGHVFAFDADSGRALWSESRQGVNMADWVCVNARTTNWVRGLVNAHHASLEQGNDYEEAVEATEEATATTTARQAQAARTAAPVPADATMIGSTPLANGTNMSVFYKNGNVYAADANGRPLWSATRQGVAMEDWVCVYPRTTVWVRNLVNEHTASLNQDKAVESAYVANYDNGYANDYGYDYGNYDEAPTQNIDDEKLYDLLEK